VIRPRHSTDDRDLTAIGLRHADRQVAVAMRMEALNRVFVRHYTGTAESIPARIRGTALTSTSDEGYASDDGVETTA
jgi:hypothetical protein